MALNTVTVTWSEKDFANQPVAGRISFQLSNTELDTTDGATINNVPPRAYGFINGTGSSDPLVANDNTGLLPTGSYYVITVTVAGQAPYSFNAFINFANGATQTLTSLETSPAVPQTLGQFLPLTGGTLTGPLTLDIPLGRTSGGTGNALNNTGDSVQRIGGPLYVYPTWASPTGAWQSVQAAAPFAGFMVANPSNGPGSSVNSDYTTQIADARAAGVQVLGYIPTGNGVTSVATIEAMVDSWYSFYPTIDGIMFDQAATDVGHQPNYVTIYNYVKAKRLGQGLVVINPGTIPDQSYMLACDVCCLHENSYTYYTTTYAPPSWAINYPACRFMNIVHDVTTMAELETVLPLTQKNRAGYIYVTDNDLYNALPGAATSALYWPYEVNWCRYGQAFESNDLPPIGLAPSGDTTGVQDPANIAALYAAGAGQVILQSGVFYTNGVIPVPAGCILTGVKGASPSIYDEVPKPLSGTIIRATSTWSAGSNSAPAIVQIQGLGAHVRDLWIDGTSNTVSAVDGLNDGGGSGYHSVNLRNVGVCNVTGIGIHQYGSEWVVFQCVANVTSSNGFSGDWVDSQLINCFAQTCGYSGTGVGYYCNGSQTKFIGCRGDVSQYGFFIDAGTGSNYTDMIQLIGCSTQRNNKHGIQIQNSSGSNGRAPVVISGCVFDGDGVNGTVTQVSGAAISGGVGGGGYASISLAGSVTVMISGLSTTASTRDTGSTPCPQYGIVTSAIGGHGPNLVSVDSAFLNANTAAINDAAPSNLLIVGPTVFQYIGGVYTGSPSTLPTQVTPSVLPAPARSAFLCTPTVYAPGSQTLLVTTSPAYVPPLATATTVAAGSSTGEISQIASWAFPSAGVLDVAAVPASWPSSGTVAVQASGSTVAVVTYASTSAGQLNGCVYVSGSPTGTLTTGGSISLSAGITPFISTGNFVAPASGDVVVTVSLTGTQSATGHKYGFALAAHNTVTPLVGAQVVGATAGGWQQIQITWLVTGLTPGTTYNFDLLFAGTSATTTNIYAYSQSSTTLTDSNANAGAPVVMTVQAV